MTASAAPVVQMRLVVEASDYDEAVRFYRDVLGLPQELQVHGEEGEHDASARAVGRRADRLANDHTVGLTKLPPGCPWGSPDHRLPRDE